MRPDQPMCPVAERNETDPLQRRPRQVETGLPFRLRDGRQCAVARGPFHRRDTVAPILNDKRHRPLSIDDLLRRAGQFAPGEGGPQHRVAGGHGLPGGLQP